MHTARTKEKASGTHGICVLYICVLHLLPPRATTPLERVKVVDLTEEGASADDREEKTAEEENIGPSLGADHVECCAGSRCSLWMMVVVKS
jgi:hypothetical protein